MEIHFASAVVLFLISLAVFLLVTMWVLRLLIPAIKRNAVFWVFLAFTLGLYGGMLLLYLVSEGG